MAYLSSKSEITSVPTGSYQHVIVPDGTAPTGFRSRRILITNYLLTVTNAIAGLVSSLAALALRVTALENKSNTFEFQSISTNQTQVYSAKTLLRYVKIFWVADTPTIRIGTTAGASDIMDDITLSYVNIVSVSDIMVPLMTSGTFYITITNGSVNMKIDYESNIDTF